MPMGIENALSIFQRLLDKLLIGMHNTEAFIYLDDAVLFSETLEKHHTKAKRLFTRLWQIKLKFQPDKCDILTKEVAYLGHII